jgi:hypothetical protein
MPGNRGNQNPGVARASLQDRWRALGTANLNRVAVPTAAASVAPATGVPVTVLTGAAAQYVYQPPGACENMVMPYGSGSSGHWARGQIIGHREFEGSGSMYVPQVLVTFSGKLGSRAGVAGHDIGTGQRFFDEITVTNDYTHNASASGMTLVGGICALRFDPRGHQVVAVELVGGTGGLPLTGAGTGGTGATSVGGAWCGL